MEKVLTRLFVEAMLDYTTSLPVDADAIHKKMMNGPAADRCVCSRVRLHQLCDKLASPPPRYERVMTSLGLRSIAPLVYKLGTPPLKLLEVMVMEISGRVKTFITNMDRMGLSRSLKSMNEQPQPSAPEFCGALCSPSYLS